MFKQRYKEANEQIHAPQGSYARLFSAPRRNTRKAMQLVAAGLAVFMMAGAGVALLLTNPAATNTNQATAKAVANYTELYALVKTAQSGGTSGRGSMLYGDSTTKNESLTPSAPTTQGTGNTATDSGKGYSNTNVQVEGVDEADITKTDGNYIYRLTNNEVAIVKADGANLNVISRIKAGKSGESPQAMEMFVNGDRLLIISQEYQWMLYSDGVKTGTAMPEGGIVPPIGPSESKTYATIYDITDRSAPKKLNQLTQSGGYLSSRMVGDSVYLISNYYVNNVVMGQPETFVPKLGSGTDTKLVDPANIQSFENPDTAAYVVVTSIGIKNAAQHESVKAVLGSAGTVYANANSLLVAANQYAEEKSPITKDANGKNVITVTGSQKTKLLLFKIDGGTITQKASATVPGMLRNQFSMDEYDGVFRLCTTNNTYTTRIYTDGQDTYEYQNSSVNALYTLDQNLNILGQVGELAKGEILYSVRFDGPVGYFVTFRQVDPLFAVDLSDARNPKVLSALKIPGFSEYLHMYDKGLLFGFGKDADADSGKVKGLKLSMFTVTDPKDVSVLHTLKLEANWSDASYNHKAILVNSERSLIAFPAESSYYIYGYDKNSGFYLKKKIPQEQDVWDGSLRGLFIGDVFYVCGVGKITAYSLSDFAKLGSVKL